MITDHDIVKLKTIFVTKDDLKRFATKDDLKRFATKEDLKYFATKKDLKDYSPKKELKSINKKLDLILDYFDGEILNHGKRLYRIEDHLNLPVIS